MYMFLNRPPASTAPACSCSWPTSCTKHPGARRRRSASDAAETPRVAVLGPGGAGVLVCAGEVLREAVLGLV
eukprot:15426731-Alexandrium_andersonii.AAC.1